MFLANTQSAAMERTLSAMWQRAQLITNNLANVDTPGYKSKKLAFEGYLQHELNLTGNSRVMNRSQKTAIIADTPSTIYDDDALSVRADGNNVNPDNEYIELARVQMQYQMLQQKISGHYSALKYAINGGR